MSEKENKQETTKPPKLPDPSPTLNRVNLNRDKPDKPNTTKVPPKGEK